LTTYLFGSATNFNPPFADRVRFSAPNPFTAPFPPLPTEQDPFEVAPPLPALWAMGDVKQPYIMQYSLNIQQEIMPDTVLTIAYQGSLGRKLPRLSNDANLVVPEKYDASQYPNGPGPEFNGRTYFRWCSGFVPGGACPFPNRLAPAGERKRNDNFGGVRMELWDGNSSYNSLKIGITRRFSSGLQFQGAYNFSRAIDDSSNTGHSDNNGGREESSGWSVIDPDDKSTMRGLSGNHIEQAFTANFSYDLPINPQGAAGLFLGGWKINGIVTAATGSPASFSMSQDRAQSGQFEISQRPELVAGFSNNPILHDGREPEEYFDINAFELAPEGFFGNVGRNTLIGPGLFTVDFGVSKDISLHEEATLQFKAEFFNITNRANFRIPLMNVFGSSGLDPSASRIEETVTTSRQIQLALKILF
jgi:hypothetical protein